MVGGDSRTPIADVELLLRERWGLTVRAERTATERDEQFLLRAVGGRAFILKISNPLEDESIIDMQTQALLHVARTDPGIPTPRVVPALSGDALIRMQLRGGGRGCVRLLEYLDGILLSTVRSTVARAYRLGALLARLGVALSGFAHPADGRYLDWDLSQAMRLRELLREVTDSELRELASRHFQAFEHEALPSLRSLRTQVIHNDFNPHNILIDADDPDRFTGIIDFGDVVRTQLINDVAIGASYSIGLGQHALELPLAFVSGYVSVKPLETNELRLLPRLMAARLAVTVAITEWRATRFPENRAYITKNTGMAWLGLRILDGLDGVEAADAFVRLHTESSSS